MWAIKLVATTRQVISPAEFEPTGVKGCVANLENTFSEWLERFYFHKALVVKTIYGTL